MKQKQPLRKRKLSTNRKDTNTVQVIKFIKRLDVGIKTIFKTIKHSVSHRDAENERQYKTVLQLRQQQLANAKVIVNIDGTIRKGQRQRPFNFNHTQC